MSEDVIRCSKCGGTVSGDTCTACGATGQAIKCEHCGATCPGDARWCPSCGRHLTGATDSEQAADQAVSGGGSMMKLLVLLGLVVLACVLIWRLMPPPAGAATGLLACVFLLAPGTLWIRLSRTVPLLAASLVAACVVHVSLVAPLWTPVAPTAPSAPVSAVPPVEAHVIRTSPVPQFVAGTVLARFRDGDTDRMDVLVALLLTGGDSAPQCTEELVAHLAAPQCTEELDPATHDVTIHFGRDISVEAVVENLRRDPDVVFAEPDYIYQALYKPNDPYYNEPYESSRHGMVEQWFLKKIQAPEAWDTLRKTKSDVRLAIIDTGIDYTHPDLKAVMARDSKGNLVGKNFVSARATPLDDNGHGTHCAGIAAADTDNGVGVAGVGFRSFKLVPAKVLTGKGYGQVDWIAKAIIWCADNGCRVESLSLGGPQYTQMLQDAINYAWSKGVIVVAAAGNAGVSKPGYPAGCNHVVGVSATDSNDHLASFSNYGTPVSVGAPGVQILATMPTYQCNLTKDYGCKLNYDSLNGTSMACPVVAGVITSLLAYQPSLSPTQAIQRVQQTADNTSGTANGGWEVRFGHGRVNLSNAISNKATPAKVGCFYGQVVTGGMKSITGASVRCGDISITTTADGMFRLANLKPGSYEIQATAGSKTAKATAAIVAGADTNVTVTLKA